MLDTELAGFVCILYGAVPLAWLGWLRVMGEKRGAELWVIATAFLVSFVADGLAFLGRHTGILPWEAPSNAYTVLQAGIVGLAFLYWRDAALLLGALLLAAIVTAPMTTDVVLFTVAGLAIVGIVWRRHELPAPLRWSLLIGFGGGVLTWGVYSYAPGSWTWVAFQWTRAAAIALFCWAATQPAPRLRLA